MKKYKVHKYCTVLHTCEIEAANHAAAIQHAREQALDLEAATDINEISGFLVDEEGDEDFAHSRFYNGDGELTRAEVEQELCRAGLTYGGTR